MIIRLLFILIFLMPNWSFGKSMWGEIGACVSNPCTCHCNPDKIKEYWPSVTTVTKEGVTTSTRTEHKYKNYCNCPPYRKTKGRSGCLKQFDVPSGGCVSNLCAEFPGPSLSSYFNPHIRIRGQFCNVAACWTKTATLRYAGECLNWAGPYGLPLKRVCARIALSGESKSNGIDDDGYTPNVHLDFEGYQQPDDILYDDTGAIVEYNPPKLCAYIDPSFFQPEGELDLFDMNPLNQPFHTGAGLSPIVEMLISIVDAGMSLTSIIPLVLTKMDVPQGFINAIKSLSRFGENTLVSMLKSLGQLNKTVSSRLGCVEVALGPFPPPFSNPLTLTVGRPSIEQICPTVTSDTGLCIGSDITCLDPSPNPAPGLCTRCIVASTEDAPCVNSSVVNNAIQNTVRIGFNKVTPVCSGTGSYSTDQCVSLSELSASTMHNSYADMVPSSLIVNRPVLTPTNGQPGFRAVYGTMLAGSIELSGSYNPNLPDCVSSNSTNSTQCQMIYGINAGNFVDVSLTFGLESGYNPNTFVVNAPDIIDPSGLTRKFSVAITRVEEPTDTDSEATRLGIITVSGAGEYSSPTQTTNQICVFDVTKATPEPVGCVERAASPKPNVFSCNGPSVITTGGISIACPPNDNNNPAVVAALTVGSNTTAGALYIPSNNIESNSPTQLNLAGNDYTAFVTDSYYNIAPFFTMGPSTSTTANYLHGTYLDSSGAIATTPPYTTSLSGNVNVSSSVKYLYGLEYQRGLYSGAVGNEYSSPAYKLFTCIEPSSVTPCPENIKNCVLANLYRNDIVDCKTFTAASEHTYAPLRKCSATDTLCWSTADTPCTASACPVLKHSNSCANRDCRYVASIPALSTAPSGVGGVTIYSCPADNSTDETASYCYYNSTMANICQITSDKGNRIYPAASLGDTLSESDYYNYTDPVSSNSTTINTNPDVVACARYLSNLKVDSYSTNIMPCDASYSSCTIKEYFSSPNPAQILTIQSCTDTSGSAVQCYTQSNSAICQLSNLLTIRYSSNPSNANPTVSANATASSIVANKLLPSGSSVSCVEFLGGMSDLYSNIQPCNNAQTVSACPIVNVVSSTNPATSVNVQKCTISKTTNCYVNPTGVPINMNNLIALYPAYSNICNSDISNMSCNLVSDLTSTLGVLLQECSEVTTNYCYSTASATCTLGCSGAREGLQSKPCDDFISLMTIPSSSNLYGNIPECSNNASCPSASLYGSGAVCTATTPICTDVENVSNGGARLFTIKNCTSSGYSVTYNSITTNINESSNYYCYVPANSTCNVMMNQSVVRTSASNATLPNPLMTNVPNICDIPTSSSIVTPPNTTPCSATNLNPSLCGIRTKTAIERGLCSDLMPYPQCAATSAHNISWSATNVGQQASGICLNGTVTADLNGVRPTRYCLADTSKETATSEWGSVTGSCIPGCGATTIGGSSLTTTRPGRVSDPGTCIAGYIKASNGNSPTALCVNRSGNESTFDPVQDPCQLSRCSARTINGAVLSETDPGDTATGTCATGYTQNPSGPPRATCIANLGASSTFGTVTNPCEVQGCAAKTVNSLNATFPATAAGQLATGTCLPGYVIIENKAPKAKCVAKDGVASDFEDKENECKRRPRCDGDSGSVNNDNNGHAHWDDADAYPATDNIWVVATLCRDNYHVRCRNPNIRPRRQCVLSTDGRNAYWDDAEAVCKGGDFDGSGWCDAEENWRNTNNVPLAP